MGDKIEYGANGLNLDFLYNAGKAELPVGESIAHTIAFAGADGRTTLGQMLDFVKKFGVFEPGQVGYQPELKAGRQLDNYLTAYTNFVTPGMAIFTSGAGPQA